MVEEVIQSVIYYFCKGLLIISWTVCTVMFSAGIYQHFIHNNDKMINNAEISLLWLGLSAVLYIGLAIERKK
jgi:hypothetical protein